MNKKLWAIGVGGGVFGLLVGTAIGFACAWPLGSKPPRFAHVVNAARRIQLATKCPSSYLLGLGEADDVFNISPGTPAAQAAIVRETDQMRNAVLRAVARYDQVRRAYGSAHPYNLESESGTIVMPRTGARRATT